MTDAPSDTRRVLVTPEDLVGYSIDGRYRLDSILGGGGMGVVYRTTQENLNREIAIKVLKLDDSGDGRRLERFRREIDIIAQLTHPNIVRVFDSGQDPELGLHYIAMELVDGAPLDELMHGHRLGPELAIDIAYEVCAALTEPHKAGIVHRDIKPANVLLAVRSDDTISVKVVDFGIARGAAKAEGKGKITTTGVVVGSPMYMAPEVARGESLDSRTDLYSLGVLIYEMVTGDTPFRGSTPVAIMLRHAVDEPPSLAEAVDESFRIPELVELVDQLLSKERRDRPDDAKAVLRRLEEIRNAHGFGRVRIESNHELLKALASKRFPVALAPDPKDASEDADPYSVTTPMDANANSPSESFSGWLVSESARGHITGAHRALTVEELAEAPQFQEPTTAPDDDLVIPTGPAANRAVILGMLAVIAVPAVIALVFIMNPAPENPVELGASQTATQKTDPLVTAAEPPGEPVDEVEANANESRDAGTQDGGMEDTDAVVPEPPNEPTKPELQVGTDSPQNTRPKPKKDPKDKKVEKAMEWLEP